MVLLVSTAAVSAKALNSLCEPDDIAPIEPSARTGEAPATNDIMTAITAIRVGILVQSGLMKFSWGKSR